MAWCRKGVVREQCPYCGGNKFVHMKHEIKKLRGLGKQFYISSKLEKGKHKISDNMRVNITICTNVIMFMSNMLHLYAPVGLQDTYKCN